MITSKKIIIALVLAACLTNKNVNAMSSEITSEDVLYQNVAYLNSIIHHIIYDDEDYNRSLKQELSSLKKDISRDLTTITETTTDIVKAFKLGKAKTAFTSTVDNLLSLLLNNPSSNDDTLIQTMVTLTTDLEKISKLVFSDETYEQKSPCTSDSFATSIDSLGNSMNLSHIDDEIPYLTTKKR